MIVDAIPLGGGTRSGMSRRSLLALAAAGFMAACVPTQRTQAPPTKTPVPTPLAPAERITPENATHVTQLAVLNPTDGRVRGIAWSPDGERVAAGGTTGVHLWDAVTGVEVGTLHGHTDLIYALAWSPANGLLASASYDHTVRVWNTQQGTAAQVLGAGPTGSPVYSVAWSPDGSKLVSGTKDGDVMVWDATTGERLATWRGPPPQVAGGRNPYVVWGVAWSPDGRRIASTRYDGLVLVWDAGSGEALTILKTDSLPNRVGWSPNGTRFATTHDDGTTLLWDGASYKNTAVLSADTEAGWAFAVTWSPDGRMLASSRETGLLQLWDATSQAVLAELRGHGTEVWGVAWSPDGLRLASASDDTTVRLWGAR